MEVTPKDLACNVSKNEPTLKVLLQTNCSSLTDTHHYIPDITGINDNNQQKTKKEWGWRGGGSWGGGGDVKKDVKSRDPTPKKM